MPHLPLPAGLDAFVADEMRRLDVPGVAAAAVHGDTVYAQGFGVTNVDYPVPVTEDTPFQIGSTSKTFTATALMQEMEKGTIEAGDLVRRHLPGFRLQSEDDAARLTIRHLFTHHGGWVGDFFRDTGRGEQALERLVAKMANSPQIVPAGHAFTYNNAGFYVLGRVLEVVTGMVYEDLIRERIFRPLGMDRSFFFPEDVINLGPAAGHIRTASGAKVAMPYHMSRATMPGGGIISSALDQARYIAFHLGDGTAPGGERILGKASLLRMREPHAEAGSMCDSIGVSWMLEDLETAQPTIKHGGATNGHLSSFELVPSEGFGVTVLTNCDSGRELRDTVAAKLRQELIGPRPEVSREPIEATNLGEYAGRYEQRLADIVVSVRDGALQVESRTPQRILDARPLSSAGDPPVRVAFYAPDRAVITEPPRAGERCEFLRDDAGQVAFLRWDGRLSPRVGDA